MKDQHPILMMIPKEVVEELRTGINKLLNGNNSPALEGIGDYISEKEAGKLLGRKTTWFWMMRTKGMLSYTKVGNKVFYQKKDIEALLEKFRKEAYRK